MSDVITTIDWTGCKRMDRETFLRLAEPGEREQLVKLLDDPNMRARGAVCFQDERGNSDKWGQRYYVLYGEHPDFKGYTTARSMFERTYRGAGPIAYFEKETADNDQAGA